MLKQSITYTDFNGDTRTEVLYFNLTEAELVDIQADSERGIQADLQDAIDAKDVKQILEFIKMLVHKSYGIKSEDGRYFRKSEEITSDFVSSALYSDLLLNLFQDEGQRGVDFITGLMPKDLLERATAKSQGQLVPQDHQPSAREIFDRARQERYIPLPEDEGAAPVPAPRAEGVFAPQDERPANPPAERAMTRAEWQALQDSEQRDDGHQSFG